MLPPVYGVVAVALVYNPVSGAHVYVEAPLAVSNKPLMPATPPQPVAGVTVTTGNAFTLRIAGLEMLAVPGGVNGGQVPDNTQRYWLLFIATVAGLMVSVAVVTPE